VKAQIKTAFENAEFIVVETAFPNLPLPPGLRSGVLEKNGTSPVASILTAYPDLFIYPRRLSAAQGCLFGVIASGEESLSTNRVSTLKKHFPTEKTAIFTESPKGIFVSWLKDGTKNAKPLDDFNSSLG